MATQVFDTIPWEGAKFRDEYAGVDLLREDGPFQERALVAFGIPRRVYTWPLRAYPEDLAIHEAFVRARQLAGEAFYVLDPWQQDRWEVEVGPSVGAQSVFSLPTVRTVDEYRDFPVAAGVMATVNGAPRGVASVNTDARTVTLASAAANGQPVKLSYKAYRLCRFPPSIDWEANELDWYSVGMEIREVLRAL